MIYVVVLVLSCFRWCLFCLFRSFVRFYVCLQFRLYVVSSIVRTVFRSLFMYVFSCFVISLYI